MTDTVENSSGARPEHATRFARKDELALVCDILASAFTNDPVMNWMSGHPEIYSALFRAEAQPLYFKRGHVFINESRSGAALWTPPDVKPKAPLHWSLLPMLWKMYRSGGVQSLKRGAALEHMMSKQHIKEPHYYLFAIGAVQDAQGRGIGSALLHEGLKLCDQNPAPVYLESSNVKNNILYQRFGFEVINELQLPDGGPVMWPMLRKAKPR